MKKHPFSSGNQPRAYRPAPIGDRSCRRVAVSLESGRGRRTADSAIARRTHRANLCHPTRDRKFERLVVCRRLSAGDRRADRRESAKARDAIKVATDIPCRMEARLAQPCQPSPAQACPACAPRPRAHVPSAPRAIGTRLRRPLFWFCSGMPKPPLLSAPILTVAAGLPAPATSHVVRPAPRPPAPVLETLAHRAPSTTTGPV